MRALALFVSLLFFGVTTVSAQMPPPPPEDDMPKPLPPEGKRHPKKPKQLIEPNRNGVKPPLPVIPPTPEPTLPDEP